MLGKGGISVSQTSIFKVKSYFGESLYLSLFIAISQRIDILYVRANNNHCFSSLCDNATHFCMILEYALQAGHTVCNVSQYMKNVSPLQITNQMITACKSYISNQGTETIWMQNQDDVVRKLNDCIRLNEEYQRSFHKTKEKLEKMPNERPFEFSEMYIFGKFDTFTRRLKKIIEIFETISIYATLQDSKIEGLFI